MKCGKDRNGTIGERVITANRVTGEVAKLIDILNHKDRKIL